MSMNRAITSGGAVKSPTPYPPRKVWVGTLAGSVWTFVVLLITTYDWFPLPPEVATAAGTLVTLVFAYLVPPAPGDTPVPS